MKVFLCLCFSLWSFPASAQKKEVLIATYYNAPPFVTGQETGLFFDLAAELVDSYGPEYRFQMQVLPRKRLDRMLQSGIDMIVLFTSPAFMDNALSDRMYWSKPFLNDHNEIISLPSTPIEYNGSLETFENRSFGGINGRRYDIFHPLVASGAITRHDSKNNWTQIQMLLSKRVDFIVMPASILRYYIKEHRLEGRLHISQKPLEPIHRQIMLTPGLKEEHRHLDGFIHTLSKSRQWIKALHSHGYIN